MIDRVLNGRYNLLALLGEGGMAVVYEAEDVLLGRRVAVKVLREQFTSDAGFLARFQREARAAAGLSHPNVVGIYDVGSDAGTQYIVMELIQGRTLKQLIQEEGPLSAARIIDIGRQICDGLEFAHQNRVVHRDVKPQNILITRDGRAKIADFGIAVALGASSLTQSGYVVGSAQYISPEQASGAQSSLSSDIYSTGVVLYEMATGQLPFDGETSVVVALKHLQQEPVPPRQINPRIPESLQAVILCAMSKDPTDRYLSAAQMAEALSACARAGMEATQPAMAAVNAPRGERKAAASTAPAPKERERRRGSSGWVVLLVVFAAFLCTLGSIPLGLLAYSNGLLGNLRPPGSSSAQPTATAGVAVVASPTTKPSPTITVTPTATPIKAPQLVGVSFTDARQEAKSKGIDVVIVGEKYSPQYPVAYVISQKPAAGQPVEKGASIEVEVSLGKEMVAVPKVTGDVQSVAEAKLKDGGFTAKVEEAPSDRVPVGFVISQNPAPDSKLEKGAEVTVTVSSGKEKVEVPVLIGLPEADAQETIVRAGLAKDAPNYQEYTTVPPGHVISQDPKPGTMVEKGTTVYIAVRKVPATQVPVPTVAPLPSPTPKR